MLDGSQEGMGGWDEETAGNSGRNKSPRNGAILIDGRTRVKQVV